MTTQTIARKSRAAGSVVVEPRRATVVDAIADIPRMRLAAYAAVLFLELLLIVGIGTV